MIIYDKSKIFKVAKIIDDRTLVITAGAEKGFKVGDCFEIYEIGAVVEDPDTLVTLGSLEYVKARIRITQIYPKMAVCSNAMNQMSQLGRLAIAASFDSKTPAALNVSPNDISGGIDLKIHVGDLVRKIETLSTEES